MGYYMNEVDSRFDIRKGNLAKALAAVKKLCKKGDGEAKNFSWVTGSIVLKAQSLKAAFDEWRWDLLFDEDGNVNDICFNGEKSGDDLELFEAVAPYVEDGSFIEMLGEDGCRWKWVFKNGQCKELTAKVSYDEE